MAYVHAEAFTKRSVVSLDSLQDYVYALFTFQDTIKTLKYRLCASLKTHFPVFKSPQVREADALLKPVQTPIRLSRF